MVWQMDPQEQARLIRERRKQLYWTQQQLSSLSGYSISSVQRCESGQGVDRRTFACFLEALGLTHESAKLTEIETFADTVSALKQAYEEAKEATSEQTGEPPTSARVKELERRITELEGIVKERGDEVEQPEPEQPEVGQPQGEQPEAEEPTEWPPEARARVRLMYYLHPYHTLIPYRLPSRTPHHAQLELPIPRVGEFVVLPKWKYASMSPGEIPIQTFKVVRVVYANEIYVDTHVRVEVELSPVTSFA
jgi:transcriptional regulator with XRE-family HTH domain